MNLMLVDAASMYFRAFHGVPTSVIDDAGQPVNAVRGYLDMTAQLVRTRRPSDYVACLDLDWRPKFRTDLVPSYKAHRVSPAGGESVPDELSPQVPILLATLQAIGFAVAGAEGFEADDVIATLAARSDDAGHDVEIVTGDRDLMALATDHVRVLYTGRGVSKLEDLGPAEIETKYGVPPARYADLAVLRGDPSDGLPGVKGVGEKTAASLVQRFGAVEDILAAAQAGTDGFPPKAMTAIRDASDYLTAAVGVVRGRTDAPVKPFDAATAAPHTSAGSGRSRASGGAGGSSAADRSDRSDRSGASGGSNSSGGARATKRTLHTAVPAKPVDPETLVELADRHALDSAVNRVLAALADLA